ncbi:REP element-mobilizing transposase RayT [Candidatus Electrothrix aarhusensis]|uniref:REP element-mobilizing transposase RayT n=1 Tax=Candidatus Electrothrix aarhusensis TaxID=1859131 RepID=A0A444J1T0_9BACT|nr:REP element-mobilizing transposase RayT [Candidatus Electrothrix aarhusensis]
MPYNPDIHHRRSIRLRNYDYAQAGAYFVTICVQGRECLFGEITNRVMRLHDAGNIVAEQWIKTGDIRDTVELDAWTVMPNHFHGIIVLIDTARRGTARRAPTCRAPTTERFGKPVSGSLPTIVRAFKSAATKNVNILRNTPGNKLWQPNYWEHIIRNETELQRIREYIHNNPTRWHEDALHPDQPPFPGETRESSPPYGHEAWVV